MANGSILAATGFEPFQLLFQSITSVFIFLTVLVVVGTAFAALTRFGIPFATAPRSAAPDTGTILATPSSPATSFARSAAPNRVNLSDKLRSIDWFQFEKLMEIVYRKQGYMVDRRGGANPDGGIDLILIKGAEKIAVQCKHWRKWNVAVPKIRELVGAMTDAKINKGVLVTISNYTDEAKALADRNGVEIVNHVALTNLLGSLDADYDPEIQSLLNDTRKFCPRCEREMELKTATRGKNVGTQFWSCTGFPKYCRHKENC